MNSHNKQVINGFILLNKPKNLSSNQALSKVKGIFKVKKAGHTGALDPLATGMLPICFGLATKYSQFLLEANKSYQVTGLLGIETTTGDAEGEAVTDTQSFSITKAKLLETLEFFKGEIKQVPPMYSALKKDGKPLYEYARAGIEIKRAARTVHIFFLELLAFDGKYFELNVVCSKGTYIRSLVEDIGRMLKVGAHVTQLHRHYSEPFDDKKMVNLETLQESTPEELKKFVLPVDAALTLMPAISLQKEAVLRLQHGLSHRIEETQVMAHQVKEEELVRIYDENENFFGIAHFFPGELRPHKMLPIDAK